MPFTPARRAVLPLVCACVLLVMIMVAAVNLAIPKLAASDLHPSASQLLWIVDAYVIVFAGLLIPCGRGRRPLRPQKARCSPALPCSPPAPCCPRWPAASRSCWPDVPSPARARPW
ncbi:hypothetical protein ACU686_05890 [Yinghuangia aomiensis]